ncbi:hypothetical protein JTB14_015870 [Gonioctena quinquepunctata]|nr:hypothetical protein JTB14_015870 [Gonioctena quinquepunctata]
MSNSLHDSGPRPSDRSGRHRRKMTRRQKRERRGRKHADYGPDCESDKSSEEKPKTAKTEPWRNEHYPDIFRTVSYLTILLSILEILSEIEKINSFTGTSD